MKLKDYKVEDRNIYKVSTTIKNIIDSEDDNAVENITTTLSSLSKEELIEYTLFMSGYHFMKKKTYNIGDKFYSNRYDIEQIYHCNATAFYPSVSEDEKILRTDETYGEIEREYFYYYDDSGMIYRSYVETLLGVPHKNNPDLKTFASDVMPETDEVLVEIVGMIPTHSNKKDLVFGI